MKIREKFDQERSILFINTSEIAQLFPEIFI